LRTLLAAMVLRLLAHEDRTERATARVPRDRDRGRDRHRAHLKPTDEVDLLAGKRIHDQLADAGRARRVQCGRAQIEIEVALAARGERDLAAPERARADQLKQLGAIAGEARFTRSEERRV